MTKSELIDAVAARNDLQKKEAVSLVESVIELISETLTKGDEINISGFGKLYVAERGARPGVNPRTGERIQIAATKVPRFTAGTALKRLVNE
ncbi:MAG TPA: HU family DNA-binding protein [Baekduia sp.]|nr:HU family DNA-binding protein [Baekduia sp.]